MKFIKVIYIVVFLAFSQLFLGCSNFLTNPNSKTTANQNKLGITISNPVSNDSIGYGNTKINYTLKQDKGINFVEVYVEGVLNSSNQPNADGSAPNIYLNIDPSNVNRRLSFYMIYYDKNGSAVRSDTVKNLLITEPPPYQPYDVKLLNLSSSLVNISWKDSSANVSKYQIWRQTGNNGTYQLLYTTDAKTFNVNDANLDPDSVYFYKIRGKNSYGYSAFSKVLQRTSRGTSSSFPPPSNVQASAIGMNQVELNWNETYPAVNYFRIQRKLSSDTAYSTVGVVQPDVRTYSDSANGLTPGGSYNYRIIAYTNTDSAVSADVYVKLPTFQMRAPTILSVNTSSGKVVLNWRDNDAHYANFEIERKTGLNGNYKYIGEVQGYVTSYTDSSVSNGVTYYYRIRESDSGYYSLYSNTVSVTAQ